MAVELGLLLGLGLTLKLRLGLMLELGLGLTLELGFGFLNGVRSPKFDMTLTFDPIGYWEGRTNAIF